jgi:DNA-binding MarR family transcriptional regulator
MKREPPRQFNLAQLLRIPFQALVRELHEQLAVAGYADIRPTHTIVFALVGPDGMRMSELAARAQLTKQLVNHLVTAMEECGYVERVPDPTDGRGKLVRLTARGQQASQKGWEIIQGLEIEWSHRVGERQMHELRTLLEHLVSAVGQQRNETHD